MNAVELVLDARAQLGEGAIWDAERQVLYWVDIAGHKLHEFNPATKSNRTWDIGQSVADRRAAPVGRGNVGGAGLSAFDFDTGKLAYVAGPAVTDARFNDGKCDPPGRFWAGPMSSKGAGSLYCLDADHSVRRIVAGVGTSNGIVWSLDQRTMYYIDTKLQRVDAFDYDLATGNITNRRVAVPIPR